MNTSRWCMAFLAVGLLVGAMVGGSFQGQNAIAEDKAAAAGVGRYQISAFGGGPPGHGCYIVDTMTGTAWYASRSNAPEKICDQLP